MLIRNRFYRSFLVVIYLKSAPDISTAAVAINAELVVGNGFTTLKSGLGFSI
jgi:hypothetical protein